MVVVVRASPAGCAALSGGSAGVAGWMCDGAELGGASRWWVSEGIGPGVVGGVLQPLPLADRLRGTRMVCRGLDFILFCWIFVTSTVDHCGETGAFLAPTRPEEAEFGADLFPEGFQVAPGTWTTEANQSFAASVVESSFVERFRNPSVYSSFDCSLSYDLVLPYVRSPEQPASREMQSMPKALDPWTKTRSFYKKGQCRWKWRPRKTFLPH